MKCEDLRQQLPDYTLGTISETETAAVRRHLRGCAACRAEADKLAHCKREQDQSASDLKVCHSDSERGKDRFTEKNKSGRHE